MIDLEELIDNIGDILQNNNKHCLSTVGRFVLLPRDCDPPFT